MAEKLIIFLLGGMLFITVVFSGFFLLLLKHYKKKSKTIKEKLAAHETHMKLLAKEIEAVETAFKKKVSQKEFDALFEKVYRATALNQQLRVQTIAAVKRKW